MAPGCGQSNGRSGHHARPLSSPTGMSRASALALRTDMAYRSPLPTARGRRRWRGTQHVPQHLGGTPRLAPYSTASALLADLYLEWEHHGLLLLEVMPAGQVLAVRLQVRPGAEVGIVALRVGGDATQILHEVGQGVGGR